MEEAKKPGMSRGCLVALIIGASLLLIVIIATVTCWYYKDDLLKMGGTQMLNNVKQRVAEGQVPEIDSTQFNAVADSFIVILKQDEEFDLKGFGEFIVKTQKQGTADEIDAQDVEMVMEAMIEFYPELEGMVPTVNEVDEDTSGAVEDPFDSP